MTTRGGATSVAELVLVFWLYALVLAAVAAFAATQGKLAARQHEGFRLEEAVRTTAVVLESELRYLAQPDVQIFPTDSIRIRAFRGGGAICRVDGDAAVVRYQGMRRPDPLKDSLLVVTERGDAGPFPIATVAAASCDGDAALRIVVERDGRPAAGLALVFEPGTYSLGLGAVRYRRGAGGRQPLTESIFRAAALDVGSAGALRVTLFGEPDSLPRLEALSHELRLASLNGGLDP